MIILYILITCKLQKAAKKTVYSVSDSDSDAPKPKKAAAKVDFDTLLVSLA